MNSLRDVARAGVVTALVIVACAGAASAASWSFAVITDTQHAGNVNPDNTGNIAGGVSTVELTELTNALLNEPIDFLLVPGDLVQRYPKVPVTDMNATQMVSGELALWKSIVQPLVDKGVGIYPVRGNHDKSAPASVWTAAFPTLPANGPANALGLTYSFMHEGSLFLGLDEYATTVGTRLTVPQAWLDTQLTTQPCNHVFVFGHVGAFPQEAETGLCTVDDAGGNKVLDPAGIVARDAFWSSLSASYVDLYLAGHEHMYALGQAPDVNDLLRPLYQQTYQVICGVNGAPVTGTGATYWETDKNVTAEYEDRDPNHVGYLLVTIDGGYGICEYKVRNNTTGLFETVDTFGIPEPATLTLLALGVLAALGRRRKGA
ncbi:MAG: metallophosphoesterase [Planctomycetota bacterium]|nr:metallophosphoesterase [Planctomycetota bacterium]